MKLVKVCQKLQIQSPPFQLFSAKLLPAFSSLVLLRCVYPPLAWSQNMKRLYTVHIANLIKIRQEEKTAVYFEPVKNPNCRSVTPQQAKQTVIGKYQKVRHPR